MEQQLAEIIREVLYYEIHAAVEREGIFPDNIDVGTVIVDALDAAFNAAIDKAIGEVIDNINIEDIISTYKLQLLYDAVQAGLDLPEVENELDLILKTSLLGEDLRKAVKGTLIHFFQDLIYLY